MTATNICKKYPSIYGLSKATYFDFFIITLSSSFLARTQPLIHYYQQDTIKINPE